MFWNCSETALKLLWNCSETGVNSRRRGLSTNCDLSREDSTSLDVASSYVFYPDLDSDYYQRIGKGSTCYRPPSYLPTPTSGYHQITNRPTFIVNTDVGYPTSEGKANRNHSSLNWIELSWFNLISFWLARVLRSREIGLPAERWRCAGFAVRPRDRRLRGPVPAIPFLHLPILQLSVGLPSVFISVQVCKALHDRYHSTDTRKMFMHD